MTDEPERKRTWADGAHTAVEWLGVLGFCLILTQCTTGRVW